MTDYPIEAYRIWARSVTRRAAGLTVPTLLEDDAGNPLGVENRQHRLGWTGPATEKEYDDE